MLMRMLCQQVVTMTVNKTKLNEFSMVYLNNLLSLPLILGLMWHYGEIPGVISDPALKVSLFMTNPSVQIALLGEAFPSHVCSVALKVINLGCPRNSINLRISLKGLEVCNMLQAYILPDSC